ncbi:MAG: serine hydrolase domain-containing protein [Phycisphaerales bacterium]
MNLLKVIAFVFILCTSQLSRAQAPKPQATVAPSSDAVDRIVLEQVKAQSLVGISVACARDGTIVLERHYGFEDRAQKVPASGETMYRWASISKPVTSVAAMQLVETGKLSLDADARSIVNEFPEKPWTITICQLLCHQGGIVHYTNGEVVRLPTPKSPAHPYEDVVVALDTFKMSPLVCEPGTKYSYSTHGYMLVAAAVQRAGGEPFWQQVRSRIAEPAGMKSFRPDYQWESIPHRAVGYRALAGVVVESTDTDVSWKLGGGGFISNVGDLSRFSIALMDDRLVRPETFVRMRERQPLRDGSKTGYGLGLDIGSFRGRPTCAHSGSQEKAATFLLMAPEDGLSVAIMCNTEGASLRDLARDLLGEMLPAGGVEAPETK